MWDGLRQACTAFSTAFPLSPGGVSACFGLTLAQILIKVFCITSVDPHDHCVGKQSKYYYSYFTYEVSVSHKVYMGFPRPRDKNISRTKT